MLDLNIEEKILRLSGLSKEILEKSNVDSKFKEIQEALAKVHAGKGVLYGDYVETRSKETKNFALLSLFFDIKRKYVRFENMAKMIANGQKIANDEITDTMSDMAVYSVMGLMLMDYFESK